MSKNMRQSNISDLQKKLHTASAHEVLQWAYAHFGATRIALASSLGAEDQVLTHMVSVLDGVIPVFVIDTGRLPQETYDVMEQTRRRLGITHEVLFPERNDIEQLMSEEGPNSFYESVEKRKHCCAMRKVKPLKRKLLRLDAWICGLRKEQAVTRGNINKIEWDETNHLVKVNPLADWTEKEVWKYINRHKVPYNLLHDEGYPSIGCAPCTRAVKSGEDRRAGRWWWEDPEHKECGLHQKPSQLSGE